MLYQLELLACKNPQRLRLPAHLLGFFVRRVLFAKSTIFVELQFIGRCTFVFGRCVVFALTLRTGQCYNDSH
jgi:hypothetical protein